VLSTVCSQNTEFQHQAPSQQLHAIYSQFHATHVLTARFSVVSAAADTADTTNDTTTDTDTTDTDISTVTTADTNTTKKPHGLSPRANYTDRAAAAC
jgi:hypothetical protein